MSLLQALVSLLFGNNDSDVSGWGSCYRCHTIWRDAVPHTTYYDRYEVEPEMTVGRGCFPLCETCWTQLETPEDRLPYYRMLFDKWTKDSIPVDKAKWNKIERAVMAGK